MSGSGHGILRSDCLGGSCAALPGAGDRVDAAGGPVVEDKDDGTDEFGEPLAQRPAGAQAGISVRSTPG